MIPELTLVIILLGALYGIVSVLYAAPRGYMGHSRKRSSTDSMATLEPHAAPKERAAGTQAALATTVVEPVRSPVQAIYETVQPAVAPISYAAQFQYTAAFGTPSIPKKPTRTYRRRVAPARRTAASKTSLKSKTRKR